MLPCHTTWRSIKHARAHQALAESRRVSLLNPPSALTHLLIWQRWQSELTAFKALDTQHTHQQKRISAPSHWSCWSCSGWIAAVLVGLLVVFYHTPCHQCADVVCAIPRYHGHDWLASTVSHPFASSLRNSLAENINSMNYSILPLQPGHHLTPDLTHHFKPWFSPFTHRCCA